MLANLVMSDGGERRPCTRRAAVSESTEGVQSGERTE